MASPSHDDVVDENVGNSLFNISLFRHTIDFQETIFKVPLETCGIPLSKSHLYQ